MAGLLEQLLARAQPGGFVDPAQEPDAAPETPKDWAAILRAKRKAENARFDETVLPLAPGSLLPFGALGAGMLPPTPSQPAPAAPALAGATPAPMAPADPAMSGALPGSAMALRESDGAPQDQRDASLPAAVPGAPLDLAAAARMPPAAAPAPAAPAGEPPFSFGRLASGVMDKLGRNSSTLLALGAGLAGAPNVGQGISRAAAAAIPASQADKRNNMALDQQKQAYAALVGSGVPPNQALAAIGNPEIMKAVVAKHFEAKPSQHVMAKGPLGEDIPLIFKPDAKNGLGAYYTADGHEYGAENTGSASGSMLAPGVTKLDPSATGEAYLAQYGPEVQAAVKAYMSGDVIPSGNPRQKTIADLAKRVAQTYGMQMGIPVSDARYQEQLTHRREMASGKAGLGLQRTALRQGLEHLEGATRQAIDLGNWSTGIAPVTEGINSVRGITDAQKGKVTAFENKIQTLAGEVGKFFSGSQGGGVHEREDTRKRFKAITSPVVLADAIDSTLELMEGGLHAREQSQSQLFPNGVDPKVAYMTPADHERIARIRELSAQLRSGKAVTAAAPAAPNAIPDGWTVKVR